jgi:hypothetical protein
MDLREIQREGADRIQTAGGVVEWNTVVILRVEFLDQLSCTTESII